MNIKVTTQKRENYVLIKVVGNADQSFDLKSFATRYVQEVIKNNVNKIILDNRELIIRKKTQFSLALVPCVNTFPLELKYLNIAIVINRDYQEIGRLWEAICKNRGFEGFNIFYDLNEAINWINKQ